MQKVFDVTDYQVIASFKVLRAWGFVWYTISRLTSSVLHGGYSLYERTKFILDWLEERGGYQIAKSLV